MDGGTFSNIEPSRFISFLLPNPGVNHPANPYGEYIRVAVVDSPHPSHEFPRVAALLVPGGREDDWIFSTESGHFQLLLDSVDITRLILVGDQPRGTIPLFVSKSASEISEAFKESLVPVLLGLTPNNARCNTVPDISFISYEDHVIRSVVLEVCCSPVTGEMLIEDVEIQSESPTYHEFRRRLRFKRMPYLVQTEAPISSHGAEGGSLTRASLVQPYLEAMVAGLELVASTLEKKLCSGTERVRIMCLGVGGGALLMFLRSHFDFDVIGVEIDEVVLGIARRYFGLVEDQFLHVHVGDAIQFMRNLIHPLEHRRSVSCKLPPRRRRQMHMNGTCFHAMWACQYKSCPIGVITNSNSGDGVNHLEVVDSDSFIDVVMIDLDSSNARHGLCAPPLEFLSQPVLLAVKILLPRHGITVINVIPPNKFFYDDVIHMLKEIFSDLYEIDVGNEHNYIFIATMSPTWHFPSDECNGTMKRLREAIGGRFFDGLKKI